MDTEKQNPESAGEQILEFPCVAINQSEHQLYGFVIPAKTLWDIVKINRRNADKDEGYQRALSDPRVKDIANYIDAENPIPNSILIALDDKDVRVSPDRRKILIPKKEDAGWVIDGQHRLAGAKEADANIEMFVIAFINIDIVQQIQQFVVINREAKGVPTSLYYDLLRHLPLPKSPSDMAKERAADIANELRKDENSTFFNRIVILNPRKGQISLTNFVRKVYEHLLDKKGKFHLYTFHEQRRILDNYFKALENVFPKEFHQKRSTFFRTLGFGAVINSLPTVFDLSLKHYQAFKVEDIVKIVKRIDDFDFRQWERYGSGSAAEIQAGKDIREEILEMFEQTPAPGSLQL